MPEREALGVAPADLLAHAAHIESVADDVAAAKAAGDAVRMGAGAYGTLCTIVPVLVDALQVKVVDGLDAAVGSLHDTGQRLRDSAADYRATDEGNSAAIAQAGPSR